MVTDSAGRYRTWEIQPYEPAVIAVDSLSLDFNSVPGSSEVVVRPSPNLFNRVDLPLQRTREVIGTVQLPEGRSPGGVSIEVVGFDGSVVVSGRTFSDGELYLQRVPPGEYAVRVADASLRALGLCSEPVPLIVPSVGDEVRELPTLHLRAECPAP